MGNILIIDDSKIIVQILKQVILEENHKVSVSYDGLDFFEIIERDKIDVILLDIMLPTIDGYTILRMLSENEDTKELPVIMITAITSPKHVKMALDMGALDYIKKPAEPIEITARINSAMRLKSKQDILKEYATKDALTKLYNRSYGERFLRKCITDISNYEKGFSYAIIDCDYFKKINDTFGHVAGDIVLACVANTINKSIKKDDVAYRFGGEEFSIILPNTSISEGFDVCDRIRINIQKNHFEFDKTPLLTTVSIGVTHCINGEELVFMDILKRADEALYNAKHTGRNKVVTN